MFGSASMETIDTRLTRLPFRVEISRHCGIVESGVALWARSCGLIRTDAATERFTAARFGLYAAAIQPEASEGDLQTYAAFLAWLFTVNDQHGEALYDTAPRWSSAVHPLYGIVQELRESAPGEDSAAAHALANVRDRVYPRMSAGWKRRFATHFAEVLQAAATESRDRQLGRVPSERSYVANRRIVSAGAPMLDLAEFCATVELPSSLRELPSYQFMREAATDVMAWTNDIVSVEKERRAGELHNYVLVLMHHRDLTSGQAQDLVIQRVQERVAAYQAAEEHFLAQAHSGVLADPFRQAARYCARAMRHFMVGHAYWAQLSQRYSSDPVSALAVDNVL